MSRARQVPEFTDSQGGYNRSKEARLWRAVIHRAILDAFALPGRGGSTVRETIEAQDWLIEGGKDFAFVCEHAGIDAGMINAWALEMCREEWPRHRFEVWKQIIRSQEYERAVA
jgi:hypothetical protein